MADLVVSTVIRTGAGLTEPSKVAAAGGGDTFTNDGNTFLWVSNGSGGALTVTVNAQKNCDQGFDHDVAISVGAGADIMMGPFPKSIFNGASNKASITYSGVTSLTLVPISLGL